MIKSYHRFSFGKYAGKKVESVAEFDPSYIWYCENEIGYRFSPSVKRQARRSADDKCSSNRGFY